MSKPEQQASHSCPQLDGDGGAGTSPCLSLGTRRREEGRGGFILPDRTFAGGSCGFGGMRHCPLGRAAQQPICAPGLTGDGG